MTLDEALAKCPVVAILRGVAPEHVVDIAGVLVETGLRAIEVPLNSPRALASIRAVADAFGDDIASGAGTVLQPEDVDRVADAGARVVVAPNADERVIERAIHLGLEPAPGFATATEAFRAVRAGARHLKLFPAASFGPNHLRQLQAVLPTTAVVWAVGGVGAADLNVWWKAGARAFGIGAELYRPGQDLAETARRASRFVAAAASLGGS